MNASTQTQLSEKQNRAFLNRWREYYILTKPRVVQLIVFCAFIGMILAIPKLPDAISIAHMLWACLGIWLVASSAAAFNCLIEKKIDARMKRTSWRPTARGHIQDINVVIFSSIICFSGCALLYFCINPITMWLTVATFIGYAIIYTVFLKPRTPQNIVIGGASGAMPPVLGWVAMTGEVNYQALILFLIIFLWTPPHFWALALYRIEDYRKTNLPMLPITHGSAFTRLQILLYTIILVASSALPFIYSMSTWLYLTAALVLGIWFIFYTFELWKVYSDALARKTFRFSLTYLGCLFVRPLNLFPVEVVEGVFAISTFKKFQRLI